MANTTPRIKVESYQHVASIGGWAGAGRTLWAISTIGVLLGAAIGLVAPLFPIIVGASTLAVAAQAIPASMVVFAAMGLSMGFGGGLMLGRVSGTAAAIAEEQEKRMKSWTAQQILHNNPGAEIIADTTQTNEPQQGRWQYVKDTCRTYINPRVGLVMTAIGLLGGLIMGAAFIVSGGATAFAMAPALSTITGVTSIATHTAGILAYSGGIGAAFGAIWNLNMPRLTNKLTEFYGKLTSGALLGREWCPDQEQQQRKRNTIPAPAQTAELPESRNIGSFRELLARQAAQARSNDLVKH